MITWVSRQTIDIPNRKWDTPVWFVWNPDINGRNWRECWRVCERPTQEPVFGLSVLGYCSHMVVQHGGLCGRHILYMILIINVMFHFPFILHTGPFWSVVSTSIHSRKIEFLNLPSYNLNKKSSQEQASKSLNLLYSAIPSPTVFSEIWSIHSSFGQEGPTSAQLTYYIDQPPLPFIHNVPLSVNRLS